MKTNRLLNFILFFMLIALAGLSSYYYQLANRKNLTSVDESTQEVTVSIKSFDELPKDEREKYIKKDEIDSYGNYLTPKSYAENFDIGDMDEPVSEDINELKMQFRTLRAQNKLLYDDNVDLVAKNLEIAQMLNSKNSDTADMEAKDQNIQKKLQIKIDELNRELNETKDQFIKQKHELENKNTEIENDLMEQIKTLKVKLQANNEQNELNLKQNLQHYKETTDRLLKTADEDIAKLKNENERLRSENDLKNSEIERIKVENSAEILNIKNGYSENIDALKNEYDKQKFEYESKISSKQMELEDLKSSNEIQVTKLNKEIINIKNSLNEAKENEKKATSLSEVLSEKFNEQNTTIASLKDDLQRQRDSFTNDISKAYNLYKNDVLSLKSQLDNANSMLNQKENEYQKNIYELKEQNSKKDSELKVKDSNITALNESFLEAKKQLENQSEIVKKNAQNYKILNDKITLLTNQNITISKGYQSRISKLQDELSLAIKSSRELNITLAKKDDDIKILEQKFNKLKNESIATIESQKNENLKLKNENMDLNKYAKLGKSSGVVKSELDVAKKQLSEVIVEKEYFESENENLKKIIQLNFKSEVPKKVVFIASIECDDMAINSDEPTAICRHRVAEFLQRYNSNYIFEVVPIVSRVNFIATSKIAQSLPKDELEKINSYANYGVGRQRAKVAGELIKFEFGDFSRISYSNDITLSKSKQGFIIKVYR